MVRLFAVVVLGFALLFPVGSLASESSGVFIARVRVDKSGLGYVELSAPTSGTPPCVSPGYGSALAFDTNTVGGRAILSAAMAAKLAGKSVHIWGTGLCSLYGVMEELNLLLVE